MAKLVTDLEVYTNSLNLLNEIYELCQLIPKTEFNIVNQIKRASQSIPANISEGFGKRSSSKEFKRYLTIAMGSSDEVITHLKIINITIPQLSKTTDTLLNDYSILSKQINKLRSNWFSSDKPKN